MPFFKKRDSLRKDRRRVYGDAQNECGEPFNARASISQQTQWDEMPASAPRQKLLKPHMGFFQRLWQKFYRRSHPGVSDEEDYIRRHNNGFFIGFGKEGPSRTNRCLSLPHPSHAVHYNPESYPDVCPQRHYPNLRLSSPALHRYPYEDEFSHQYRPNGYFDRQSQTFRQSVQERSRPQARYRPTSGKMVDTYNFERGTYSLPRRNFEGVPSTNYTHCWAATGSSQDPCMYLPSSHRHRRASVISALGYSGASSSKHVNFHCHNLQRASVPRCSIESQESIIRPRNCTCRPRTSGDWTRRASIRPRCMSESNEGNQRHVRRHIPPVEYDIPTVEQPSANALEVPTNATQGSTSVGSFNPTHAPVVRPLPSRPHSAILPENHEVIPEPILCARCRSLVLTEKTTQTASEVSLPPRTKEPLDVDLMVCGVTSPKIHTLTEELHRLSKYGWYWGPISRLEAEEKLKDEPDGAFLVRDSSDDFLVLSLYVRSVGKTLFVRIEHGNGKYSLHSRDISKCHPSVVSLIEYSMKISQFRAVCYTKPQAVNSLSYPVRLTKPVSRFSEVRSLQYLCRFVIRYSTRVDHVSKLPLPKRLIEYVEEGCY